MVAKDKQLHANNGERETTAKSNCIERWKRIDDKVPQEGGEIKLNVLKCMEADACSSVNL